MLYYALIGDIVASREIAERAVVQRQLKGLLPELNAEVRQAIAAPLRVVAGDEVQGLLADPNPVVDIVVRVADALHPSTVSWGLGCGQVTTDLDPDVSLVDGPTFHEARTALDSAVREGTWLSAKGFPDPYDAVFTTVFRLIWAIRSGWTDTQLRYVCASRGRLQHEAAERLGVTKQSVSKTLDAARFAHVHAAEETLRTLLRRIGDRVLSDPGLDAQ